MASDPAIGLALGGGGARGLVHIHVLEAMDDLGLRPAYIAGTSIGAIIGAAYASGMSGAEIREHTIACFATRRLIAGRIWRTRPPSFADFLSDGGVRLGQMNAERVLDAFLPPSFPRDFAELGIPLTVLATDFYGKCEFVIEEGPLINAIAASAALPAMFRPVRRKGVVLIDGGVCNPLPFDHTRRRSDIVVAVDVTGGPEGRPDRVPTPIEAMIGASQLMMHSIIETKLMIDPPDLLVRPPVSRYKVMDFLRAGTILAETAHLRETVKVELAKLMERPAMSAEKAVASLNAAW